MNIQKSPFAGLATAELPRRTNTYLNDGKYIAEIMDVKKRVSEHPSKIGQVSIIIELAITDVIVDKGNYTTPGGDDRQSNQAGEVVTVFIKMSWAQSLKMLKSFLCSAAEFDAVTAAKITDVQWVEFAEKACYHLGDIVEGADDTSDWVEQPLKGKSIKISAQTILTSNGNDFTRVDFEANPEDD